MPYITETMVKYKISKNIREKFDWTITRKRKRTGLENSKKKQKTGIFMETKLMEQKNSSDQTKQMGDHKTKTMSDLSNPS